MKFGSYHRIGKYDLWYGYQGSDTNSLRIEWPGDGMKVLNAKLVEGSIVKTDEDNCLRIFAKTTRGTVSISRSSIGRISIQIKWWFIPIFWASGKESGYKGESLLAKICSTNGL